MLAFAYNISFNLISSRSGYHCSVAAKLVCQSNKVAKPRGWISQGVKREPEKGIERKEWREKDRKKERKRKESRRDRIKGQMQKPHTKANEELSLYQEAQEFEEQGGAIYSNLIIY